MSAPSAPANVVVKSGQDPQGVRISWDATADTDTYEVYWSNVTGVSTSAYKGKRQITADREYLEISGIAYQKVFATVTATNGDGSSSAATEASGFVLQNR
jgi:hypothetical protein